MDLRALRPQIHRTAIGGDRVIQSAHRLQRRTQAVVHIGQPRIDRQGSSDQIDGSFMLPGLMRDDAEQVKGVRVIRIQSQDVTVNRFRLRQLAGGVMMKRTL